MFSFCLRPRANLRVKPDDSIQVQLIYDSDSSIKMNNKRRAKSKRQKTDRPKTENNFRYVAASRDSKDGKYVFIALCANSPQAEIALRGRSFTETHACEDWVAAYRKAAELAPTAVPLEKLGEWLNSFGVKESLLITLHDTETVETVKTGM